MDPKTDYRQFCPSAVPKKCLRRYLGAEVVDILVLRKLWIKEGRHVIEWETRLTWSAGAGMVSCVQEARVIEDVDEGE